MDARDYFGPVNKCRNCNRPCTKNLDGTWSTRCSVCKEAQARYMRRKSAETLEDSDTEDDEPIAKRCSGCDGPSSRAKGGSGWNKYCNDCQESTSAIFRAIWTYKTKRRLLEEYDDLEDLQAKKAKLEQEILDLNKTMGELEKNNKELGEAQADLFALL